LAAEKGTTAGYELRASNDRKTLGEAYLAGATTRPWRLGLLALVQPPHQTAVVVGEQRAVFPRLGDECGQRLLERVV
jgi:hypothetical protein